MDSSQFLSWAVQPVRNLQVTFRGKKYDIADGVTTVAELQERVKENSSSSQSEVDSQTILFGGKRLGASDNLSEVGVKDGDQLSMVPLTKPSKKKSSTGSSASTTTTVAAEASASPISDTEAAMKEYLKNAGIDPSNLDDMLKSMGGAGGAGGGSGGSGMPGIAESMEMMQNLVNSPMFQEYMSDPEKLEQSRQMILANPMLKSMMASMPGMEELLNDKDAWREAMQAAANLYKTMDKDDLMKAMMSGQGGMNPSAGMGGLFDGTLDASPSAKAALDELDEDD